MRRPVRGVSVFDATFAVNVAMGQLFFAGFAHFGNFHIEVQGRARQRMVAIHGDVVAFNFSDGEQTRACIGLCLELHARQHFFHAFKGVARHGLDQAVMTFAVAFSRFHFDIQLVARLLAGEGIFQAGDDVAMAVQVGQWFVALAGRVQGGTRVIGQGVVDCHYGIVCDLHEKSGIDYEWKAHANGPGRRWPPQGGPTGWFFFRSYAGKVMIISRLRVFLARPPSPQVAAFRDSGYTHSMTQSLTQSLAQRELIDGFGRRVDYVRLSVTDRCDFRCVYCMAEDMTFLPRADILSLEELHRVARVFVALGVKRIRLTGGEPLVRPGIEKLAGWIAAEPGLDELTLTTNAGRLASKAAALRAAGVRRLNISLDSLDEARFHALTRTGKLADVLAGIQAARDAGFERIRLNSVIMRGRNEDEVLGLTAFALDNNLDIAFIEEMPLGAIDEHSRAEMFVSSDELRATLAQRYTLVPATDGTAGPSRYWHVAGAANRVGFISPHSHNFCHLCNRVRVTVEGRLLLCLGNEHSVDLKPLLRDYPDDDQPVMAAIVAAMDNKPERHHFRVDDDSEQLVRFMNMTGG